MSANETVGFVLESGGRGTISLIWSCLSTWFISLWVIFHINIPDPQESNFVRTLRQAGFMIFGAFAPEFIAAIAYTQKQNAERLLVNVRNLHKILYFPLPQTTGTEAEIKSRKRAMATFRSTGIEHWTLTHSFYCIMGGFTIFPPESPKPFPVNSEQLLWLLKYGYIELPSISLEELKDKSKSDSLLKSIAIFQALWFLIQCVGRYAQSLPTTTLEITTIAYVLCMIPCQLMWWSKPYNVAVGTPLHIIYWPQGTYESFKALSFKEGYSFYIKRDLNEYPRMLNFIEMQRDWIGGWRNLPNWAATIFIGLVFGSTHCIAWGFHFATTTEALLWRASSLTIVGIGLLGVFPYWIRKRGFIGQKTLDNGLIFFKWVYMLVRTYLMVEVFIAFRSMPKGVYNTVDWLQYVQLIA
jgi:hypothetical protein